MCGRYSTGVLTWSEIVELYGLDGRNALNLAPRYNVAPTQEAPVVLRHADEGHAEGGRAAAQFRWGLVPGWSKGPDSRFTMINARAETVAEKPAYRAAFRARRCLVPADGFYEWRRRGDRQPFRYTLADGGPMTFAGLWEEWAGPEGPLRSFTIVTVPANELLAEIHDRMPAILAKADFETWLSGPAEAAGALLRPFPATAMRGYPVGRAVNRVGNEGPDLIAPLESPPDEGTGRLL